MKLLCGFLLMEEHTVLFQQKVTQRLDQSVLSHRLDILVRCKNLMQMSHLFEVKMSNMGSIYNLHFNNKIGHLGEPIPHHY